MEKLAVNGIFSSPSGTQSFRPEETLKLVDEALQPQPINARKLTTAWELLQRETGPDNDVVPGLFPIGYALLGGREKTGKSLLALGSLALDVARGKPIFGEFKPRQGPVIYYALEDSEKRLKKRLHQFLGSGLNDESLENLFVQTELDKLDEGGFAQLESEIAAYRPILVIIDTLAIVHPDLKAGSSEYRGEYSVGREIQRIAQKYELTIIAVHHTTKKEYSLVFDELRGTGITSAADTLMVLKPGNDGVYYLHVTGRDIELQTLRLARDPMTLRYTLGSTSTQNVATVEVEFESIFADRDKMRRKEIEAVLAATYGITSRLKIDTFLKSLKRLGQGLYGLPD